MPRPHPILTLGLGAVFLAGCIETDDKIATYSAPSDKPPERVRLLAAVVPQPEKTWFFKLSGPTDAVAAEKGKFDAFVQSVQFTGKADPPLTWTTPDGWKQEPGSTQMRFATFKVGDKDPLEATIVALDGEAGTLIGNVNRWRDQIGLEPVDALDLDLFTRQGEHPAGKVTFVDMGGPGKAGAAKAGMGADGPQYVKPEGWEEKAPGPQAMHLLGFVVKDGDRTAEVTLTPFPGDAGGLIENVKRWRKQIGLEEGTEQQIRKDAQVIPVSGVDASYFDLKGPNLGEGGGERILGVVVPVGQQTWFIKMKGPSDLLGKQKKAFESFAGSLRLDGGKGAKK